MEPRHSGAARCLQPAVSRPRRSPTPKPDEDIELHPLDILTCRVEIKSTRWSPLSPTGFFRPHRSPTPKPDEDIGLHLACPPQIPLKN